jgi:hypothetical protein
LLFWCTSTKREHRKALMRGGRFTTCILSLLNRGVGLRLSMLQNRHQEAGNFPVKIVG